MPRTGKIKPWYTEYSVLRGTVRGGADKVVPVPPLMMETHIV
jgi:hypothetical protein